jgi:hypothetical protein
MAEKRGADFSSNWVSSGDLSAAQFRCVLRGAGHNQNDVFLAGSGDYSAIPAGVLQNKPRHGEFAGVINGGWTKLQLGSSMGVGEFTAGANGFPTAVGSSQWCMGILYTSGVSGEVAEAYVNIHRKGTY